MPFRFDVPRPRLFTPSGALLANGSLKFLEAGSSSTLKATFSDPDLATANPNPINTGSDGVPVNPIWMDGVYRVIQYSGPNGTGTVLADDDLVAQDNIGGTLPQYSASYAASAGYEKGALLQKADGTGYWQNTTVGNATNPDAAGAGWISLDRAAPFPAAVVGNGIANDHAIIQAYLNTGKDLYIPAGVTIKVNSTLNLVANGQKIIGPGKIVANTGLATVISASGLDALVIDGLTIEAGAAKNTYGIGLTNCTRARIANNTIFKHGARGISIVGTSSNDIIVQRNTFLEAAIDSDWGVRIATDIALRGSASRCIIDSNMHRSSGGYGISAQTSATGDQMDSTSPRVQ